MAYFCTKTGKRIVAPGVCKEVDPENGQDECNEGDPEPKAPKAKASEAASKTDEHADPKTTHAAEHHDHKSPKGGK